MYPATELSGLISKLNETSRNETDAIKNTM